MGMTIKEFLKQITVPVKKISNAIIIYIIITEYKII